MDNKLFRAIVLLSLFQGLSKSYPFRHVLWMERNGTGNSSS